MDQILIIEEHKLEVPGIDYQQIQERHYPKHINGSHFLGYVIDVDKSVINNIDNPTEYRYGDLVGWSGLEKSYERFLKDTKGIEYIAVDVFGREIGVHAERHKRKPIPGITITFIGIFKGTVTFR